MKLYTEGELKRIEENLDYIDAFYDCIISILILKNKNYKNLSYFSLRDSLIEIMDYYNNNFKFTINDSVRNFLLEKFKNDTTI